MRRLPVIAAVEAGIVLLLAALLAIAFPILGLARQAPAPPGPTAHSEAALQREVRHVLVMLPQYTLFDNLAFRVNGYQVTLLGQVTDPTLKSAAEAAVKGVEGVEGVDNRIEVLPLSPQDDQIRRAVFRAIYSEPGLERYAEGAVPPIHIIVKNGSVTLEGVVASQGDKNLVNLRTQSVPGVFSVTNHLAVENSSARR